MTVELAEPQQVLEDVGRCQQPVNAGASQRHDDALDSRRRSAIAHRSAPTPRIRRAGWSAAMITSRPSSPSSGRRRRFAASSNANSGPRPVWRLEQPSPPLLVDGHRALRLRTRRDPEPDRHNRGMCHMTVLVAAASLAVAGLGTATPHLSVAPATPEDVAELATATFDRFIEAAPAVRSCIGRIRLASAWSMDDRGPTTPRPPRSP